MNKKNAPKPTKAHQTWFEWALRLVAYLDEEKTAKQVREPVRLAYLLPGDTQSASEDGVLMFDPALKKVVVSIDGAWIPLH